MPRDANTGVKSELAAPVQPVENRHAERLVPQGRVIDDLKPLPMLASPLRVSSVISGQDHHTRLEMLSLSPLKSRVGEPHPDFVRDTAEDVMLGHYVSPEEEGERAEKPSAALVADNLPLLGENPSDANDIHGKGTSIEAAAMQPAALKDKLMQDISIHLTRGKVAGAANAAPAAVRLQDPSKLLFPAVQPGTRSVPRHAESTSKNGSNAAKLMSAKLKKYHLAASLQNDEIMSSPPSPLTGVISNRNQLKGI